MTVLWSESAELSFNEELQFISRKWGYKQVEKFIHLVDECISILASGKITGKRYEGQDIYLLVISKQTTLVYSQDVTKGEINLLLFWNNKRDPTEFEKFLNR